MNYRLFGFLQLKRCSLQVVGQTVGPAATKVLEKVGLGPRASCKYCWG